MSVYIRDEQTVKMLELIKSKVGLKERSEAVRVAADYYIRTYLGIKDYEKLLDEIVIEKRSVARGGESG